MQETLTSDLSQEETFEEIKVYTTRDYSLFKTLGGNRSINQLHLIRLKKSMQENPLITIIQVNEKFEIIDGQHRFLASQELNLPIYYIISKNYGLKEVQIFNNTVQKWSIESYINGYADYGYEDYVMYRDFVSKYKFTATTAILLLSGSHSNGDDELSASKKFKNGLFKVKNFQLASEMADKLYIIKPYYAGFLNRYFILAMYSMFRNNNFNFFEFMSKLKLQPTALKACANTTQYKSLIEDIYNYKRREKVNLRFANHGE
jgi:hypothetical protein